MGIIEDSAHRLDMGVNKSLHNLLKVLGYSELYPPQECALSKGVTEGKNLLIVTPLRAAIP
jgi:superfamily II helicase